MAKRFCLLLFLLLVIACHVASGEEQCIENLNYEDDNEGDCRYTELGSEGVEPKETLRPSPALANVSTAIPEQEMNTEDEHLRFNYAAKQCGAKVVESNGVAMGRGNILLPSPDSYMLTICSEEKWIVIELCEEIVIDSLVISNLEFFSSTFKDFTVYGSNNFPTDEWIPTGHFQAENIKMNQNFEFGKKEIFRYLKIHFQSYYGVEYYCPVTFLGIFGHTLVEDLKEQVEISNLRLQTFNKLVERVTRSEVELDWIDLLPPVPEVCTLEEDPISEFDLSNLPQYKILESFIHSSIDSEDDSDEGSNIFADLASHITKLEMKHALLSRYLDQFKSGCAKQFALLATKRTQDFNYLLEAIDNATLPFSYKFQELSRTYKTFSLLQNQFTAMEIVMKEQKEAHSLQLILTVCLATICSILATVSLFCLVFESPPRRKTNVFLNRLSQWDTYPSQRSNSQPSFLSEDTGDGGTTFAKTHKKQHSS